MSKSKSIPQHIDAPTSSYFAIGTPSKELPYEGDPVLKVLKQDFVSIDGTFPDYGNAHPSQSGYKLFHITPEEHIGGGIIKATCFYSLISGTYEKKIRQSVNFYGVRQREVTFQEQYKAIERKSGTSSQVINGTLFVVPYVQNKEVKKTRDLIATDLVAREPFSEEVTCTQFVEFYNTAVGSGYQLKEKLLVKDTNTSFWKKGILEAYENQKHEQSLNIANFPQAPEAFINATGTNYLSETSTPSASWYASVLNTDGYIVQPTNIEPYYAGTLIKVDWLETKYR